MNLKKDRLYITLFFGGIFTVLVMLFMFNPVEMPFFPQCLFHNLTGWSCPGCGLQRAIHALLHGNFAEAASYNYWLLFTLPYLLALFMQRLMPSGRTKEKARRLLEHKYIIAFYIVSFFAWFAIRNIWGL